MMRPFLKWPGGKSRILNLLAPHLKTNPILVEPFVGAGSVFLNFPFEQALLNDVNSDLINLFKIIKKNSKRFSEVAQKLFVPDNNCATAYYQLRARFNDSHHLFEKAILFLYLNKHGFNGLCRYNSQGLYNVPFGSYQRVSFPAKEIDYFNLKTQTARFSQLSFEAFFERINHRYNPKDLTIYCDPPYAPLSKTAHFTNYAPLKFTLEHQQKLADLALKISRQGAWVVISNHDTPFTRQLYKKAKLVSFQVQRDISGKSSSRVKVSELLAIYGG